MEREFFGYRMCIFASFAEFTFFATYNVFSLSKICFCLAAEQFKNLILVVIGSIYWNLHLTVSQYWKEGLPALVHLLLIQFLVLKNLSRRNCLWFFYLLVVFLALYGCLFITYGIFLSTFAGYESWVDSTNGSFYWIFSNIGEMCFYSDRQVSRNDDLFFLFLDFLKFFISFGCCLYKSLFRRVFLSKKSDIVGSWGTEWELFYADIKPPVPIEQGVKLELRRKQGGFLGIGGSSGKVVQFKDTAATEVIVLNFSQISLCEKERWKG